MFNWFPWNGSKKWLISELTPIFKNWSGENRFIDPFVGGGSISYLIKSLFPETRQVISDVNPWLISAFKSQLIETKIVDNFTDLDHWRGIKDCDYDKLTVIEQANRFAICLFTAWGNRWKSKSDGSMSSENPINKKFAEPNYLRNKLEHFFKVKWLDNDLIKFCDWKETVKEAKPQDLIYIDPPYPESLGYGNQVWSFSDQLDIVDWVNDAIKNNINVVVSNMATIERLYRRMGMETKIIKSQKSSKTRVERLEVLAWKIFER